MSSLLPTLYFGPEDVVEIVQRVGLSRRISGDAERIKRDFLT